MKKYNYYINKIIICLLVLASVLTSCDLDETTFSDIQTNQIPDTDDGANMWAIGVYNGLTRMFVYDEFPRCLELDQDYITGPSWAFGELGGGNFQGTAKQSDAVWKRSYDLINRSNEAIEYVNRMENVTPNLKQHILGEMYFLQAFGYFLVVRAYGDSPIFKYSINQGNDPYQPRQPIAKVYEHIIDLLSKSKDMLYKNTDTEFNSMEGRVCAGAAATLLAKVYATIGSASMQGGEVTVKGGTAFNLVMEDGKEVKKYTEPQNIVVQKDQVKGYESFNSKEYYEKAQELAYDIVYNKSYGNHQLIPYSELWKKTGRNSREHFFAVQFKEGDEANGELFTMAYSGQIVNGYVPSGGGLSRGMRHHWYRLFEDKDYRITEGVLHRFVRESNLSWNGGGYYPNNEEYKIKATGYDNDENYVGEPQAPYNDGRSYTSEFGENYLAYTTKYADVTNPALQRTDAIFPFLRFADAVLIYAEASNEVSGPNSQALAALNDVRARSNASAKWLLGLGGLNTKEKFRSAVLEERAMEFALETDRRWDLIRWGIYLQVMNAIGVDEINTVKSRENKHLLYPIPDDEILTNHSITENNPGWN